MKKFTCIIAAVVIALAFSMDVTAAKKDKAKKEEAKKEAPTPINDKCPLTGKAVNAEKTSTVTFNVCCKGCKKGATKNPTKALAKLTELPNKTCPMKGKDVTSSSPSVEVTVGFCCGKCKDNFDKDAAKHLAKVKAKKKEKEKEKA